MFSPTVEIDLTGFRHLRHKTINDLTRACTDAARNGAIEGRDEAKRAGQYHDHTGRLRGSIEARHIAEKPRGSTWAFETRVPYAIFVEDGTKPHDIWPKEGHGFVGPMRQGQSRRALSDIGTHRIALRWFEGGQPVFARMVHHPGSKAYPFMGPGALKAGRVVTARLELDVQRIARMWN